MTGREMEQVEARRVAPVNVVQDDEDGLPFAQPAKELGEVPVDPRLELSWLRLTHLRGLIGSASEGGHDPGQFLFTTPGEHRESGDVHLPEDGQKGVGPEPVGDARLDFVRLPPHR